MNYFFKSISKCLVRQNMLRFAKSVKQIISTLLYDTIYLSHIGRILIMRFPFSNAMVFSPYVDGLEALMLKWLHWTFNQFNTPAQDQLISTNNKPVQVAQVCGGLAQNISLVLMVQRQICSQISHIKLPTSNFILLP